MINAIWGISALPFKREANVLLPQQKQALDMIHIHARHGGFSVIIGEPGVGKTILREHLEQSNKERDSTVVCCSRTMHTYRQIIWQLADAFLLDSKEKNLEADLIEAAFAQVRERKTLYILIDEAHLLEWETLRKLRLLFERFPKSHNLVLFGQPSLLHGLSLSINKDIKSRITYSCTLKPLNDEDMERYIQAELKQAKMGINTFDEGALQVIVRAAEGNLRLCRNLCLGSLIEAAKETQKTVTLSHVNHVLIQPHWRTYEDVLKSPTAQG